MDTEDLLPRLLLFAGIVAVVMIYRKRRGLGVKEALAPDLSEDERPNGMSFAASAPGQPAPTTVHRAAKATERGQSMLENVLDNIADQAMKELKTVVSDGLNRLQSTVDKL
jgi:hypothetical protein